MTQSNIRFQAVDYDGRPVACHETTYSKHQLKHGSQYFDDDMIIQTIQSPDLVARTGHNDPKHQERLNYYKEIDFRDGGPRWMKVGVEHRSVPGYITTMFRTSKWSKDGTIVHMSQNFKQARSR